MTKEYGTSDLYLACYLRYLGYKLLRLDSEGERRIFIFQDRVTRQHDILAYHNNEATVAPMSFAATIRDTKGLLYQ